jgi:uncharacterized protein YukE
VSAVGEIRIDTDQFATGAEFTDLLAQNLAGMVADLQTSLAGYGDVWGDDTAGRTFHATYSVTSQQVTDGVSGIALALESATDGLKALVKGYTATEEANVVQASLPEV